MRLSTALLSLCILFCAAMNSSARELDYSRLTKENHPRLIFTDEYFDSVRNGEVTSPVFLKIHNQMIAMADSCLTAPEFKRVLSGKRMLDVSRDALKRIPSLAYAYKITGKAEYLKRAEHDLITVCHFENWNARRHWLDTGEMALAVAFGYDWLYDVLPEDTKALIRKAFNDFVFDTAQNRIWNLDFYKSKNNWNQVCNAGLVAAALTIYEDYPDAGTMIEKSIKANRKTAEYIYSPDGNYPEGYSYWNYGTCFQVYLNTILETATGSDAGLSEIPGWDKTAWFMVFMPGCYGECFNFADCWPRTIPAYAQWYFAYKFNNPSFLLPEKQWIDEYTAAYDRRMTMVALYYAYKMNLSSMDNITAPEQKIYHAGGTTPVVIVHDNWKMDDTDKFLGIKGGKANSPHGHMDCGSFVYDAFGARWAEDMGPAEYGKIEAQGIDLWNMRDGSERWDLTQYNNFHHNTLTVNGKHHKVHGRADFIEVIETESRKGAVIDITAPLDEVESAVRTIYIEGEDLVVIDEIKAKKHLDAEIQWTFVTRTKPSIKGDAIELRAGNGKTLYMTKSSSEALWWVSEGEVLRSYNECGYKVNVKAGEKVSIEVRLTPDKPVSPLDGVRKAFMEAITESYAPSEELTDRFIEYSSYGKANDVLLTQLYTSVLLPDKEVERLIEGFDKEKRGWKDIDYTAQDRGSWPSTLHVTRMQALAKIYKAQGSSWENSKEISELLHLAMGWWFDNMPVCPNWWHQEIGVPKKMAAVLVMLRDELSPEEIEGGLRVLEKAKFGRTGQNKSWLAGNNLMRGLLIDDPELVKQARDYIVEEIYITKKEGIQEDWSFHQHGPQIQFGNYGLAYADGNAFWLRVLKDSEYAFSAEHTEIVTNMLKKGICQSLWKGIMDPNFCGRQNFINGGPGKAFAVSITAQNMAAGLEGEDAEFFANVAAENLQPELYSNSIVGGSYFWRSDCGIWRRPEWYSSIRMHSKRTIGYEHTNKENTLANFSADGALMLIQDGKEFDNIFAIWNWRKLPGVTAYDDGKPLKCDDSRKAKQNNSSYVGGLVFAGSMAATMELNRDGLHALKTAFFFDDCVVNLGTDIYVSRSDFHNVTTSLDQIHLKGEVECGKNWAHHRERGYISLDGKPMVVSASTHRGKWDYIDPGFKDYWDEGEVFTIWFYHPVESMNIASEDFKADSYAYMLLPCSSARETSAAARKIARGSRKAMVKVLCNNASCQAVQHGKAISAVFHKPGIYELAGETFEISEPSIFISDGAERKMAPVR